MSPELIGLSFDSTHQPPLWVSRFMRTRDAPLIWRNWPGLFESYTERRSPITEFAVNNSRHEEVAFYLSLAWRMTNGLSRHAIPTGYWEEAQRHSGKVGRLVRWEYQVDPEEADSQRRDLGFVPARSHWTSAQVREAGELRVAAEGITPELLAEASTRFNPVGALFALDDFHDLVTMLSAGYPDAASEVNLFGIGPNRGTALRAVLNGGRQPSLGLVLGPGETFIDISVGYDLGTFDSITIASAEDHRGLLDALTEDLEVGMAAYQQEVPQIQTMAEFFAALSKAIGIDPPRPIPMGFRR